MINPEKYTRPRMSKKTTEEDRWFSILGSEREHKSCWITCTSHSFFSSSSLLLILWLMNVKERGRKRCLAKKKNTPQIQGCCCSAILLLLNPRDSFVMIKSLVWVPPSSSPSFHAYIWRPTSYVHYSQSNNTFLKWVFFTMMTSNNSRYKNGQSASSKFDESYDQ